MESLFKRIEGCTLFKTQCVAELTADDISQIVSMVVDKIKRDNRRYC